jgi:SAM-dependent methyltransferase
MDAEALELEDQSIDVVVSLFALFHFPNPLTALKEMYRVLRPRGRLVIGVGTGPPWFSLFGFVHRLKRLREWWRESRGQRLTAPGLLNTLVEKYFPAPFSAEMPEWVVRTRQKKRRVQALMRRTGFTNLSSSWTGHQVEFEDPREFWDLQVTFSSIARKRLARVLPEKTAMLRKVFLQICMEVQRRGGELAYPSGAYYVLGERP